MSAFMVSKQHIDAIVATAFWGPEGSRDQWSAYYNGEGFGYDRLNQLGEMLVKENLSSIHARYPDTLENPEGTPGPIEQYWLQPYTFKHPAHAYTAVEILKAIDCYEYQSCEHDEWATSTAAKFCNELRGKLIGFLPGYDAAPWEILKS